MVPASFTVDFRKQALGEPRTSANSAADGFGGSTAAGGAMAKARSSNKRFRVWFQADRDWTRALGPECCIPR